MSHRASNQNSIADDLILECNPKANQTVTSRVAAGFRLRGERELTSHGRASRDVTAVGDWQTVAPVHDSPVGDRAHQGGARCHRPPDGLLEARAPRRTVETETQRRLYEVPALSPGHRSAAALGAVFLARRAPSLALPRSNPERGDGWVSPSQRQGNLPESDGGVKPDGGGKVRQAGLQRAYWPVRLYSTDPQLRRPGMRIRISRAVNHPLPL
jgi:hypothetical protein